MTPDSLSTVKQRLQRLQASLSQQFEASETSEKSFFRDEWSRDEGGGGISLVLEGGETFEKVGVNFSHVSGPSLPPSASAERSKLAGRPFHATGVSVVAHPRNPYVPTSHANLRFFLAPGRAREEASIWWFGGGFDLTPYYGFEEDAIAWHRAARAACEPFGSGLYERFKRNCDEYFHLPHRAEPRGIGGIFFDDFDEGGFDNAFGLMESVGEAYGSAYGEIVQRRHGLPYGQRERDFQTYRRGRYVEFNLVYDRGTLFGLQSKGRVESILMSLPPIVQWKYNWTPEAGSPEAELYDTFLKPRDWLQTGNAAESGEGAAKRS